MYHLFIVDNPSRPPQSLHLGDSTSMFPYPTSGVAGPATNMTLSLASSTSSRRQDDYSDMRGVPIGGSYHQHGYMDMDRSSGHTLGISFDRQGPVEGSDHFYTNTSFNRAVQQPQPLTPTEARDPGYPTARKTPVPKPRARTTLKSGLPTLTQDGVTESLPPETFTSVSDTYEIVDRPPVAQYDMPQPTNAVLRHPGLPLSTIPERTTPPQTNGNNALYNHVANLGAGNDNPPTRLQENVTQYPNMPAASQQMHYVGVTRPVAATATVSHKVCAVCNTQFGDDVTQSEFNAHCIDCAERATEGTAIFPIADTNKRQCPMCPKEYDAENQIEFENHVQSHFQDETPGGWEQVSATNAS